MKNLSLISILRYLLPAQKNIVLLQQALSLILSCFRLASGLEIPNQIKEEISVELEEPSNILPAGKCDIYKINYSRKSAKIVQNSNSDSSLSPGFSDEGKKESLQP